jgi:CRP/FNR family cyclic AMP-dependent transcriptional regulator
MADLLGYVASSAVLASFLMRTMVPLRLVAILSNILFLSFGYIQNIHPILFLHLALLPINVWRLLALRQGPGGRLTAAPIFRKRLPDI